MTFLAIMLLGPFVVALVGMLATKGDVFWALVGLFTFMLNVIILAIVALVMGV